MKKKKLIIAICLILFIGIIIIQCSTAIPYVRVYGHSVEAQRELLPVLTLSAVGLTAIYFALFCVIGKEHKVIRGFLIYFMVCGILSILACAVFALML